MRKWTLKSRQLPRFTSLVSSEPGLKARAVASKAHILHNHSTLTADTHCSRGYADVSLFRKQNAYGSRVFVQEKEKMD